MNYKITRNGDYKAVEKSKTEDIEHRAYQYTYKKKVNGKWRYYYGEPIEKRGLDTTGITQNKDGSYNSYGLKFKSYKDAVANAAKVQKAEEIRKKNQEPIKYHTEKLIKNLKASSEVIGYKVNEGKNFITSLFNKKKRKKKVQITTNSSLIGYK